MNTELLTYLKDPNAQTFNAMMRGYRDEFATLDMPTVVFNHLYSLQVLEERPDFHPEPSTLAHVLIVYERAKMEVSNRREMMMVALLHDIMKLELNQTSGEGWPTAPGHGPAAANFIAENTGVQLWMRNLGVDPKIIAAVCAEHMRIKRYNFLSAQKQTAYREKVGEAVFIFSLQFSKLDNMVSFYEKTGLPTPRGVLASGIGIEA